jgi:hypothetical protein
MRTRGGTERRIVESLSTSWIDAERARQFSNGLRDPISWIILHILVKRDQYNCAVSDKQKGEED